MPPTADSPTAAIHRAEPGVSGKWVILGILAVAFAAAGGSWWFRYTATHRAAEFWGPQAAQLIRDAPRVIFFRIRIQDRSPNSTARFPLNSRLALDGFDERIVSKAHGIAHLRNALLEDRSFGWPPQLPASEPRWRWALVFMRARGGGTLPQEFSWMQQAVNALHDDRKLEWAWVLFTEDCSQATIGESSDGKVVSCRPIAAGLREMFAEFAATGARPPASSAAPAAEAASPDADVAK